MQLFSFKSFLIFLRDSLRTKEFIYLGVHETESQEVGVEVLFLQQILVLIYSFIHLFSI